MSQFDFVELHLSCKLKCNALFMQFHCVDLSRVVYISICRFSGLCDLILTNSFENRHKQDKFSICNIPTKLSLHETEYFVSILVLEGKKY